MMSNQIRDDLAQAVRADHPCDECDCDIVAAIEADYSYYAALNLIHAVGSIEAPRTTALIADMGTAFTDGVLCEERLWIAYYTAAFTRACPGCGAYQRGRDGCSSPVCHQCGRAWPVDDA